MSYLNMSEMTNEELLQVIIREKFGDGVARNILSDIEIQDVFYDCTYAEFRKKYGVTKTKAEVLIAIQELFIRLSKGNIKKRVRIGSPEDVYNLMVDEMRYLKKEQFVTLLLNTKNEVLSKEVISIGSLNASIVHPREVLKPAISRSANSIILCHNHPSYNHPEPSQEDISITERIKEASEIIGIKCLDHIIVSGTKYYSFRENQLVF